MATRLDDYMMAAGVDGGDISWRDYQAESGGFFSGVVNAGASVVKGVTLTGVSAAVGLANTIPLIANAVGDEDTMEYYSTLEAAEKLDNAFDTGTALSDFYQDHSQGVELAGAIAGSIIPGGVAVKGSRLLFNGISNRAIRAAEMNSGTIVGKAASFYNFLSPTQAKTRILRSAYGDIIQGSSAITNLMPFDKFRYALAAGGQLAVDSAVFEAASILTQKQNPTYSDIKTLGDFTGAIGTAAVFGGGLGSIFGAALYKGAKFAPAAGDSTELTLRETMNIMGDARTQILDRADFGEKLKNIASGTKIASIADDRRLSMEAIDGELDSLFTGLPAKSRDQAKAASKVWFEDRQRYVATQLKELTAKLIKTKDSDIGEAVYKALLAKTEEGIFPATGEKLAKVFGNLNAITRLFTQPFGDSVGLKAVSKYSEDALNRYAEILSNTTTGMAIRDIERNMKAIRDEFAARGFRRSATAAQLPEDLKDMHRILGKLSRQLTRLDTGDFKLMLSDPTFLTPAIAYKYKIPQETMDLLKTVVDLGEQKSIAQFFDLKHGRHVSTPTATLGDFMSRIGGKLKYRGGNIYADDGAQILLTDVKTKMGSGNVATTDIESQLRWSIANRFLPHGANVGKGIDTANGGLDMYKLAATIDAGGPIYIGGVEVSKEIALQELTKGKKWMYNYSKNVLGYHEERARLFADLPAEGDLGTWLAKQGRENNFMQRRNVVMAYEKAVNVSEIELKSMEALRGLIEDAQVAARNATYGIAGNTGVVFNPAIRGALETLAEFGLTGEHPVDFASRVGAGAGTNASGRLWQMQTYATAIGTWTRDQIIKLQAASRAAMSTPTQELLKDPAAKVAVSLFHRKATTEGIRYVDANFVERALGLQENAIARILGKESNMWISKAQAEELIALQKKSGEAGLDPEALVEILTNNPMRNTTHVENETAAKFLKTLSAENGKVFQTQLNLRGARGYNVSGYMEGELYFPPLDVTKNPFFAMVRDASRSAIDGSPRYSFVHARSAAELKEIVNKIETNFPEVTAFTKAQIEADKKLAGEFEWAQSFSSYSIDSKLHSKNIFGEFQVRNTEELIEESMNHIDRMHTVNMRESIRNISGDFIDSMGALSDMVDGFAKSTHGKAFAAGKFGAKGDNVYSQITRTLLDVSPSENAAGVLGLFARGQHGLTDFVDGVATIARDSLNRMEKPWGNPEKQINELFDHIQKESVKLGMDATEFSVETAREMSRLYNPANFSKTLQQKLNAISVMGTLMLDFVNPIVQSISLPITINSSIRRLLHDAPPEVLERLKEISVTGRAARIASKATVDYWKDIRNVAVYEKMRLGEKLSTNNLNRLNAWIKTPNGKFFKEMADTGLLPPSMREAMIEINQVTDIKDLVLGKSATWTKQFLRYVAAPNRYAEVFQRYAALKVADGMATAAKLNPTDRYVLMHSFAAQSNGVYTAAQRPGLFQGAIGGAFGLYKSYAINMLQAITRHIEDRDVKAVLGFAGLQGTIFGGQSIPGAPIVNKYIIAQNDEDRRDLYSTANLIMGESAGNTMLYGLGSAVSGIGMYTRGDFNYDVGSPLDPKSYPSVNQFLAIAGVISNSAKMMGQGGSFGDSLLYALSHQSLSRPVARMAEFGQGGPVTSSGNRPYKIDDYGLWSWNFAVRMMGAKPYNEAVLSDKYFRENQHRMAQSEAMKSLRMAVRNSIESGAEMDFDDLAERFVKAGGNPRNLRQWYQGQVRNVNEDGLARMQKEALKKGYWLRAQQLDGN